ncbi:MAG TPA: DUF1674 domain-containing protein [Rhizomicrobium sp.]|nr:DUF1674 domain-containing protein [Rhizomicrobium sp.]
MSDQAAAKTPEEQIAARIIEAGVRAKAEAEARRQKQVKTELPPENGGPKGLEPTRYGDWERKGIAVDF